MFTHEKIVLFLKKEFPFHIEIKIVLLFSCIFVFFWMKFWEKKIYIILLCSVGIGKLLWHRSSPLGRCWLKSLENNDVFPTKQMRQLREKKDVLIFYFCGETGYTRSYLCVSTLRGRQKEIKLGLFLFFSALFCFTLQLYPLSVF